MTNERMTYTAFAGERLICADTLKGMLMQTKAHLDRSESAQVLIFEDESGRQIDFDFRGSSEDVLARLPFHPLFASVPAQEKPQPGPGRPRLGVVCREVSMLPRHWEWLERQPGGSSAALRRLVDEARKREPENDEVGKRRDAAGKFMLVMAGNLSNFEEVTRALYAGRYDQIEPLMQEWPNDIREHSQRLIDRCAQAESTSHESQPSL